MRQMTYEKGPHSLVTPPATSRVIASGPFAGRACSNLMGLESVPVPGFRLIQFILMITALVLLGMPLADAQPRSASAPRQAPALPQSGHQTEAIDLNEGKTPAQMFSSDCAVCHQRPNGLAKGRNAGQLATFLRQHYTTGTQQAGMLAAFLTSDGMDRGAPAPAVARDAPDRPGTSGPVVRPPAPIGTARRPADGEDADSGDGRRKPAATEASRPADREGPASARKPAREERKPAERQQPATSARSKPAVPDIKQSEAPTASVAAPETPAAAQAPAASPPAEEKPAAPPPPPVPEIRI